MADEIHLELAGLEKARRAFDELPKKVLEKGLKAAATAGATPIVRALRRNIPVESGLSKKAASKKVKLYRADETAVAIIGVNRKVSGTFDGRFRKPSKYFRILEGGAKPHGYKTRAGFSPGFPGRHMLQDAQQEQGANALEKANDKLAEVIEREADKLK